MIISNINIEIKNRKKNIKELKNLKINNYHDIEIDPNLDTLDAIPIPLVLI